VDIPDRTISRKKINTGAESVVLKKELIRNNSGRFSLALYCQYPFFPRNNSSCMNVTKEEGEAFISDHAVGLRPVA
jgi:hypothetical protein